MSTIQGYIDRLVAEAPPLTPAQLDTVGNIMNGQHTETRTESPERERARRDLWDAEETLRKTHLAMKDAIDGCRGCGLTRKIHALQKNKGLGYHDFTAMSPDETIAVIELHKPKLESAGRAVEVARARVKAA